MSRTLAAATSRLVPALFLAALFAVAVAGCGSSNTAWKKGQQPAVGTAPQTGQYELVSGNEVIARFQVFAGEPLGFRKNDSGRTEAVAGMYTTDLVSTRTYTWRMSTKGVETEME